MTEQEPKSECCGADVYRGEKEYNSAFGGRRTKPVLFCSKCHKPCKVKGEGDEKTNL